VPQEGRGWPTAREMHAACVVKASVAEASGEGQRATDTVIVSGGRELDGSICDDLWFLDTGTLRSDSRVASGLRRTLRPGHCGGTQGLGLGLVRPGARRLDVRTQCMWRGPLFVFSGGSPLRPRS
jgi:hypothetical protein